ncbi:hypothetical protein [uncultured Corynebacterium sp.]|mgnify:CR=1 FL=1|jgi:hypothetical protein|uniref:hypothetical protein n=1 Tax=uncultured Corynebacterium sp. TaxID=159447 RepID=UPI0025CFDE27|nr:hypothetical protein [uncultured Corynebacterium sp.]
MTSAESDGNYPVIAVVAGEGPTAVWHIDTDPLAKTGQFVGAWIVGTGETSIQPGETNNLSWAGAELDQSVLPMLIDGHPVVPTDSGRKALAAIDDAIGDDDEGSGASDGGSATWSVVNVDDTVAAIKEAVTSYKEVLKDENTRRKADGKSTLKGQAYPDVGDVEPAYDAADALGVDNPLAKECWAWAEGIRRLVDTWNGIDAQRRAKATDYLQHFGGKKPQPIPLVTRTTER